MLSYIGFLVCQEHYKDLLQEAEHERLIRAVGLRQLGNQRTHRKIANWIGAQMVRWGYRLQRYGTAPLPCYPQVAGC
jgi:chromosome condensin MukBEF MukE localization factor